MKAHLHWHLPRCRSVRSTAKKMIAAFFIVYMLMLSYIAPLASAEQAEAVLEVQLPHLDVRAEYKPGLIAKPKNQQTGIHRARRIVPSSLLEAHASRENTHRQRLWCSI